MVFNNRVVTVFMLWLPKMSGSSIVDEILTNYIMIENTLLLHIRNQYPKVNQKSEYRKISSISILTNCLIG